MRIILNPYRYNAILIAAMLIEQGGYILSSLGVKDIWYKCNAATMLIAFLLIFLVTREDFKIRKSRWSWAISLYAVILSVNQCMDEFIGDPTKVGWNEYIFAIIILVHSLHTAYDTRQLTT